MPATHNTLYEDTYKKAGQQYESSKEEMLSLTFGLSKYSHILRLNEFVVITDSNTVLHWSTMKDPGGTVRRWLDYIQQFNFTVQHRAGKYNTNADLISRAKHMDEPSPSCIDSITQGKEEIYPLPWTKVSNIPEYIPPRSRGRKTANLQVNNIPEYTPPLNRAGKTANIQVNNISEYIPPSCTGKICTQIELPWHLSGNNGMEGRGPSLIGAIQGKIAIDQYDLEKAQIEDGSISLVKSWFNKNTGKVDDKNIDTEEFETLHSDVLQLYKVRKQLELLTLINTVTTTLDTEEGKLACQRLVSTMMELMGSLVAVRLYQKIKDSLRMEIEGVRFFTDSSAVLGMLNKDSEDWFPRNFPSIFVNMESKHYHLWWCKYVLRYWLLPATTFTFVFSTLII